MSVTQCCGVVILCLALLTGCSAPGVVSPTPTTTPSATHSATPEAVAAPGPRSSLGCDELVEAADLQALLGDGVTLFPPAFPDSIVYPGQAAVAQTGAFSCGWSGADSSLSIAVAPADILNSSPSEAEQCDVPEGAGFCGSGRIAGPFYIQGHASLFVGGLTESMLRARYDRVMDAIASNLEAGGILPAWTPPERSTVEFYDCTPFETPEIEAALQPVSTPGAGGSGDGFAALYRAQEVAGYGTCTWDLPHPDFAPPVVATFSIEYTPGGAWAWPSAGDSIVVAGADRAVANCNEFTCQIDAVVGETWISAAFGDDERDIATVAQYLTAIIPALPIASNG